LTVKIVPYDEKRHYDQLYELFTEYAMWHKEQLKTIFDVDYEDVIGGTFQEVGERVFPLFTSLKPPDGLILVLEDNGKPVGVGRLSILEDRVAEINNMYISQDYRGHGFGKLILDNLIEKAREFGYETLRLDTSSYSKAAQHIYHEAGFVERDYYGSSSHGRVAKNTTEAGRIYYENKIYMEKKL
jgi:GNAT superfamily N-acetyltransferase